MENLSFWNKEQEGEKNVDLDILGQLPISL